MNAIRQRVADLYKLQEKHQPFEHTASQYRLPDDDRDGVRNVGSLALQPPDVAASPKSSEFKRYDVVD
jgi:hypothetical protein